MRAQELAIKAHNARICAAFLVVTLLLPRRRPSGTETNTIPGMTARSLLPDSRVPALISSSALALVSLREDRQVDL